MSNIVDTVEISCAIFLVHILLVRTDNLQWVVREEDGTVLSTTIPQLEQLPTCSRLGKLQCMVFHMVYIKLMSYSTGMYRCP